MGAAGLENLEGGAVGAHILMLTDKREEPTHADGEVAQKLPTVYLREFMKPSKGKPQISHARACEIFVKIYFGIDDLRSHRQKIDNFEVDGAGSSKMTISSIVVRHGSHEIRK